MPYYIFLPFIVVIGCITSDIHCEKFSIQSTLEGVELLPTFNRQRRYDFYQKYRMRKIPNELLKYYEFQKKLQDFYQKQQEKAKNDVEMKRKKIYEKFLLPSHSGSSFLKRLSHETFLKFFFKFSN